jgi:hypothetical protein
MLWDISFQSNATRAAVSRDLRCHEYDLTVQCVRTVSELVYTISNTLSVRVALVPAMCHTRATTVPLLLNSTA